mmetsp:Transcript_36837/g.119168  ORF Transcript_36837/g.119168 Transcript_36837/m.119168 type:complete len:233 (+) Transcript_36837:292-990(+)
MRDLDHRAGLAQASGALECCKLRVPCIGQGVADKREAPGFPCARNRALFQHVAHLLQHGNHIVSGALLVGQPLHRAGDFVYPVDAPVRHASMPLASRRELWIHQLPASVCDRVHAAPQRACDAAPRLASRPPPLDRRILVLAVVAHAGLEARPLEHLDLALQQLRHARPPLPLLAAIALNREVEYVSVLLSPPPHVRRRRSAGGNASDRCLTPAELRTQPRRQRLTFRCSNR